MIYIGIVCIIIIFSAYSYKVIMHNKRREYMSFKESLDLTEVPIITFYNGGNKFNFMLDTGCNSCILTESVTSKIKGEVVEGEGYIHGMEGNLQETNNFMNVIFKYKDKEYESVFQIVNMDKSFDLIKENTGVTVHGILGNNFFEKYKYILDFNKMIAYSK